MTPLSKPVTRKSNGVHRGGQLVVTLYPGDVIGIRHWRTRKEYRLPLAAIYDGAVRAEVLRQRDERSKARKAKSR